MQESQAQPSEPSAPKLKPVFTVLVGGHRQARLRANWLSLGDAATREARLRETLEDVLRRLRDRAAAAFASVDVVYEPVPPVFRILTGQASGSDSMAMEAAAPLGYDLHVLAPQGPGHCGDCDPARLALVERGVAMGMVKDGESVELDREAFELRDDLAVSFSDVLVAIWDAREPENLASGTAFMIRDALLQRQPVVILELDPERDSPRVRVVDPRALTDAWLVELQVLGASVPMIRKLFDEPADAEQLDARLDEWMIGILLPFQPALNADNAENRLLARIERQRSVSHYAGQWIGWLLGRTGLAAARPRPLGFIEWVTGSWLWLQVMLSPPQRSQPLRVLDILDTEVRDYSWQETFVNRLHGFFSAIARLEPRGALRALRQPPCRNRYDAVRPSAEQQERHPIVEPDIEQTFNWADAQATVYGTRYRDDTWMIYYAAAFAVFCAVAGAIHLWPAPKEGIPFFWVALEFVLLHFIVRRVLKARFRDYHGHWMSFRFVAEQLRYLRLGYPLLVLPGAFSKPTWEPAPADGPGPAMRLHSAEVWLLQRMMIAEGLPRDSQGRKIYEMTRHNASTLEYISEILEEHRGYYRQSFHNLHRDHRYLHRLAFTLFTLTFFAVTLHFFFYLSWILIFTAFFPAWGAAIHGILSQNEVVRVSAMAGHVWQKLTTLTEAFRLHQTWRLGEHDGPEHDWRQTQDLRELVKAASGILSDENKYWRSLLQHNQPNLPG